MFILETEDIKYNLIKEIGKGGTCSVYKGYPSEDSSTLYAIKIYKEHCKPFYDKEISIHETLKNINLFLSLKKSGIGYIYNKEESDEQHQFYLALDYMSKDGTTKCPV